MGISKTSMVREVFYFKRNYYLKALINNDFNFTKVAKDLGSSQVDIRNHVGNKLNARQLALELELI